MHSTTKKGDSFFMEPEVRPDGGKEGGGRESGVVF